MESPHTPKVPIKKTLGSSLLKTSQSLTPCRRLGLGRPLTSSLKKSLHLRKINTPEQNITECLSSSATPCEEVTAETCETKLKVPIKNCVPNKTSDNCVPRVRRCLNSKMSPRHIYLKKTIVNKENDLKLHNNLSESLSAENSSCETFRYSNRKKIRLSCKSSSSEDNSEVTLYKDNESYVPTDIASASKFVSVIDLNTSKEDVTSDQELIEQLVSRIEEKKKRIEQLQIQEIYAKKHNLEELRSETAKWKKAGQEALRYSVELAKQAGYSVTIEQLMAQHGFPLQLMGYNIDEDEFES